MAATLESEIQRLGMGSRKWPGQGRPSSRMRSFPTMWASVDEIGDVCIHCSPEVSSDALVLYVKASPSYFAQWLKGTPHAESVRHLVLILHDCGRPTWWFELMQVMPSLEKVTLRFLTKEPTSVMWWIAVTSASTALEILDPHVESIPPLQACVNSLRIPNLVPSEAGVRWCQNVEPRILQLHRVPMLQGLVAAMGSPVLSLREQFPVETLVQISSTWTMDNLHALTAAVRWARNLEILEIEANLPYWSLMYNMDTAVAGKKRLWKYTVVWVNLEVGMPTFRKCARLHLPQLAVLKLENMKVKVQRMFQYPLRGVEFVNCLLIGQVETVGREHPTIESIHMVDGSREKRLRWKKKM